MTLTLHEHPFAAYCWKPLIALGERGVPFGRHRVDTEADRARRARDRSAARELQRPNLERARSGRQARLGTLAERGYRYVLHRDAVTGRAQSSGDVVGGRALHPRRGARDAAEDVAAADDHADLDAELLGIPDEVVEIGEAVRRVERVGRMGRTPRRDLAPVDDRPHDRGMPGAELAPGSGPARSPTQALIVEEADVDTWSGGRVRSGDRRHGDEDEQRNDPERSAHPVPRKRPERPRFHPPSGWLPARSG